MARRATVGQKGKKKICPCVPVPYYSTPRSPPPARPLPLDGLILDDDGDEASPDRLSTLRLSLETSQLKDITTCNIVRTYTRRGVGGGGKKTLGSCWAGFGRLRIHGGVYGDASLDDDREVGHRPREHRGRIG